MTDQELRERVASLAQSQWKTDRQLRENFRQMREDTLELQQKLDRFGDKFGSFKEGLALPSMATVLGQRFSLEVIAPSVRVRRNGRSMVVDVLAFSNFSDDMFVLKVQNQLREESLEQMHRILREFRDFFPIYKDKRIFGILAAVDAPGALQEKVLQEGIYLARIHDGQFELEEPETFQPRAF